VENSTFYISGVLLPRPRTWWYRWCIHQAGGSPREGPAVPIGGALRGVGAAIATRTPAAPSASSAAFVTMSGAELSGHH